MKIKICLIICSAFLIDCASISKKEITITGTAYTWNLSAYVVSEKDSLPYYLDNIKSWPEEYNEKRVEVTGILKKVKTRKYARNDRNIALGSHFKGGKLVLVNPRWRLVEEKD